MLQEALRISQQEAEQSKSKQPEPKADSPVKPPPVKEETPVPAPKVEQPVASPAELSEAQQRERQKEEELKKLMQQKKQQQKTKTEAPEATKPSAPSSQPSGGLSDLPAIGKHSQMPNAVRLNEIQDMKEASKEILAMAKNLDVSSPEKQQPAKDPLEEAKVGGIFKEKASNPNQPSKEAIEARKAKLQA